jgi:superfamily II DNA or RNA helicase/HKD family nuclease
VTNTRKPQDVHVSELVSGLYEALVTERLAEAIRHLGDARVRREDIPSGDAPKLLARHVSAALERALRSPALGREVGAQLSLCNRLLQAIQARVQGAAPVDDLVAQAELLLAVLPDIPTGFSGLRELPRPMTPLSQDALLVNARREPVLAAELRREIASADRIDLLCAFVIWSGVRVLLDDLTEARQRNVPVRLITTTYTGATDQRSLDELAKLGVEVCVSYDSRTTRLHAKAWLFERDSGYSTAYVGSSNLSHSAIHEGLEWNVRLAEASSPQLVERFRAAFETYWADPHFEPYDPVRFAQAQQREGESSESTLVPFEIRPWPFQEEMLRRLDVERRRHDRWHNLLVAATGTGKTVVSAFDYRRLVRDGTTGTLLFVAHRREILQQSLSVFRNVLRDGAFGELMVDGARPSQGDHVFASIQTLSRLDLSSIDPAFYDMVVIDEFHHAEARTYRRLLEHLKPKVLLGMTATPERTDPSEDVKRWFGGRIAVELRLWDALEQGLLCPFQYFGVSDDVDLTSLEWRRGSYDVVGLSGLYTGNDARLLKVVAALQRYIRDPGTMRALGFCVSIEHAEYMAAGFRRAGIAAEAVSAQTLPDVRSAALRRLRSAETNILFAVDLFNEGLDIPEIDTVLLLRPTESATVFLQQLGRGLRKIDGKAGLTVLDFIGQQHRQFRFEPRFAALTGLRREALRRGIEDEFPFLPAGCSIRLDRVAQEAILQNLRAATDRGSQALIQDLRELGDVTLREFLEGTEWRLDDVYRSAAGGWTELRRRAGQAIQDGPRQSALARAIGRIRHIDDRERVGFYGQVLRMDSPPALSHFGGRHLRLLNMLHVDLWDRSRDFGSLEASLEMLWAHPSLREELVQLLDVLGAQAESVEIDLGFAPDVPLLVHERYTRQEVVAALGLASPACPRNFQEGVLWAEEYRTDVLFVTLEKTVAGFSPSTMYRDYAISPTEFHWESQSTTSERSPTGQRYVQHTERGSRVVIFARERQVEGGGQSVPFLFLGPATYQRHRGDRPMAINWRLQFPLPGWFFQLARAVA